MINDVSSAVGSFGIAETSDPDIGAFRKSSFSIVDKIEIGEIAGYFYGPKGQKAFAIVMSVGFGLWLILVVFIW